MNKILGFLIGILTGGLLGAALALLFAPSSGEQLRQDVRDRIEYVQSEVKLAAQERRVELEQQLAELRSPRRPAA
jgi:gas vesicle protein